MPIEFQIQKFFEMKNVFKKVKLYTAKMQEGEKIDHFIKGRLWKEKMKNFRPDQVAIPFHFYGDGVEVNNPLGPHSKSGEQQFNYFSFPTIPAEYASRLENIFVAQIYPGMRCCNIEIIRTKSRRNQSLTKYYNQKPFLSAKYHAKFSNEQIYNNIVDLFTKLAEVGIVLNIDGEDIQVFFVCGLFIGIHYDIDVATENQTETGIKEFSIFNRIPLFHVIESSSVDLAHDVTEGTLHTIFTKSIGYFIKKQYSTIDDLNDRMHSMDFGEMENGNRPVDITIEKIKSGTLKMSSSEMFFFAHHFTLMIGDCVPNEDPVWQLLLTAIKFFDLCYLPSYDQDDIDALREEGEILNRGLMNLFNVNLKHKSHLSTHYDELTQDFGPLRYVVTIRYFSCTKIFCLFTFPQNRRFVL